jgi:adenine C2-methylase RlmN of 23S rRNA A2503 and tRNA A37
MPPIDKALKKEHLSDKKEYLQNELKSLGIKPDYLLQNEPNDKKEEEKELQALAESIKSAYYQAYKAAYGSSSSSNANNNSSGSRLANNQTPEKRE